MADNETPPIPKVRADNETDNETPPIPKVRDDGAYSLLQKQGKIEYQSFLLESNQDPIFDLNGASDMTKSDAPEKMKRTLELVKKLDAAFNKKTGKRLIINDAIAKEGTSREKQTPGSQHFHGTAVDLGIKDYSNEERDILAELALGLGFTGLGFGAGILHVDTGPQRSWSYGNNTYGTKSVSEWKEIAKNYDHSSSKKTTSQTSTATSTPTNPLPSISNRSELYDQSGERRRRARQSSSSSSLDLLSFGINQLIQLAPDTALSQIQKQLGSDLEFLAPDVLSSIQSGEGIDPLVSLVDTLTSQDTVAGRVSTLGEFAESNKELTSLFSANLTDKLPALPLIIDLLNASPRDRARIVLENKDALQEMLGIDLSSIPESFEYDGSVINLLNALQGTDTTIKGLEFAKGALDIANLALPEDQKIQFNETAEAVLQFIKSDDPQIQKEALNKLQALGVELPDEVNYLTATPEELLNNPVVKSELGQAQMLIDPSKGKQDIENMISTYISEQSSISVSGAKTLAFGGGAEAAKKLQSEVGSIAFEGLVESFPILGQIIEFFNQNQGLLTVLGTAGAAAGLSAFTGGGFFGSMVAGAGVMATARLTLGEEGYSEFEGILGQGAEQAVGIFREAFQASGLADNEYVAPIVEGLFNFTENNPVASALGATGNLGGALGTYLAQNAIDTMDNPEGVEKLIEGLRSRSNMSSQAGLSQTINNSNGGDQNVPYRPSDQNNPENDTGPKSQEIARVSGDMYRSQAWAHVDADSGYGWPHNTINS